MSMPDESAVAIVGAVLALLGCAAIPLAFVLGRRFVPAAELPPVRWGFAQLLGVLIVALGTSVALALLHRLLFDTEPGMLEGLLRTLVLFLAVGGLILVIAATSGQRGIAALGLRAGGNARAVAMGAAAYLLLLPLLLGISFSWPRVIESLGGEAEPQAVMVGFLELGGGRLAAALVLGTLVLPFFEELIFRGFVQPVLVRHLRPFGGVVITSGIFAILHGVDAFLPVFVLSLVLGAVMFRTGRLSAAWLVHGLHNGLMLALVLLVPGVRELIEDAGLLSLLLS